MATRLLTDDEGADFVEYALIVGLISVATATLVNPLMPTILAVFDKLVAAVSLVKP